MCSAPLLFTFCFLQSSCFYFWFTHRLILDFSGHKNKQQQGSSDGRRVQEKVSDCFVMYVNITSATGSEPVDLRSYSENRFVILVTAHHLLANFFRKRKSILLLLQSDLQDRPSSSRWGEGGKQLHQPALQLRQHSAVSHPIRLDSAEINSVDKLLAKRSGGKGREL